MMIGAFAAFFLYTMPHYAEAKVNNERLTKVADALKKAKQLSDIRNRLTQKYDQIPKEDLDRIKKMLPDSVENIGLIIELNNIANSKGIELLNPSITGGTGPAGTTGNTGAGSDSKKYGSIGMTFSVNTTYDRFLDLLQELENTLRLVDITSINFAAPEAKDGPTTFSVNLQTYWLK
jgi:hypothetical protein